MLSISASVRKPEIMEVVVEPSKIMDRSATMIQSAWRGYAAFASYQRFLLDVVIVQSFVRCRQARIGAKQRKAARKVDSDGEGEPVAVAPLLRGDAGAAMLDPYPKLTDETTSDPEYKCDEYDIVERARQLLYKTFPTLGPHFGKFLSVFRVIHDPGLTKVVCFVVKYL
jgi:hypothetical protein